MRILRLRGPTPFVQWDGAALTLSGLVNARFVRANIVPRAYQLWDAAGGPEGRSEEFYFQAEEDLPNGIAKEIGDK